jgi:hypothetical protein
VQPRALATRKYQRERIADEATDVTLIINDTGSICVVILVHTGFLKAPFNNNGFVA